MNVVNVIKVYKAYLSHALYLELKALSDYGRYFMHIHLGVTLFLSNTICKFVTI